MYRVLLSPRTSPLISNFGSGCRWLVGFTSPRHFYPQGNSPLYLWGFCSGPTGERGSVTYCLVVPVGPNGVWALWNRKIFCPPQESIWTVSLLFSLIWLARSCGLKLYTAGTRSWSRADTIKTLAEWKRWNLLIFIRFCGPSSPYWPGRHVCHSRKV